MVLISLLSHFQMDNQEIPKPPMRTNQSGFQMGLDTVSSIRDIQDCVDPTRSDSDGSSLDAEDDSNMLKMFEGYSAANSKGKGLYLRFFMVLSCTEHTRKTQSS